MKNKHKLGVLISLMGLLLTSCTPPLWFIEGENNSQYGERQQLIFTHLWQKGSDYYTEVNEMIKTFNDSDIAKELNVYVKGNGINFWDYWDKVNNSISGGQAPDIFIHAVSSTPSRLKYNLDLTKMHDDDVAASRTTLDSAEMFYPSQINDISKYASNNHMYAWPFSATVRVVYYNKDMFEEAGITKLPTNWTEMEEVSKKLTTYNTAGDESSGYKTIGYDPFTGEGQYMHQWGWLANHTYWTKDSNGHPVPHFNDADYIANMNKLDSSYVRRTPAAQQSLENFMSQFSLTGQNPFVSGKLGMMINNEGMKTTLKEAKVEFKYGVFEIPPMDSSCNDANWSSSYSIECFDNAKRKNTDSTVAEQRNRGSWEFLKYLYGKEPQGLISKAGFMIANRQYYEDYIYSDEISTELTKAIEHTKEAEYFEACPNWTSDIQTYVNNIYSDKMTVEQAMNSCQNYLVNKIDQYYSVN